ncbi:MAG: single-stranded DNA-binding protein [Candidatus Gracilibacteria bacterium]|jgi:single-strand DNA-binding protein
MRNINKVILIGNVVRDPEVKTTQNGQAITTFEIATNREWMTKDGRKSKSVEFHHIIAWAHLAEICQKYLYKGKLIYVEGYLKTRNWEDENKIKKFRTEIVISDMIMLDKNHEGNTGNEEIEMATSAESTDQPAEI